jgi:hypothetical protein
MQKPEIIFPDGSKLLLSVDEPPTSMEIDQETMTAVKALIAEFPNAKPISSVPNLP